MALFSSSVMALLFRFLAGDKPVRALDPAAAWADVILSLSCRNRGTYALQKKSFAPSSISSVKSSLRSMICTCTDSLVPMAYFCVHTAKIVAGRSITRIPS